MTRPTDQSRRGLLMKSAAFIAGASALAMSASATAARPILRTPRELVEALGGVATVAAYFGTSQKIVLRWFEDQTGLSPNGDIPRGFQLEFYLAAERAGFAVDVSSVFGLRDEDVANLAGGARNV